MESPLSLSLEDLKARDRVALPITFECAGNGRALLQPRPLSQPWLTEAVGTAEWGGTPLKPLLDEALMIEPTETETRERLDGFADIVREILAEAAEDPSVARSAPHTTPVRRLDEAAAAKRPVVRWRRAGG